MPHEPGHEALRNYENPRFWKRGAETFATTLRIASAIPFYAPVALQMRQAASALDLAASKAPDVETSTINPQDSPLAPYVPKQMLDIIESQMDQPPPKKKRKVSKSQKNFGKALKEVKKKHPRIANKRTNSAKKQLFKKAWALAKKMK